MLNELHVKNLALIEEATLEFGRGLHVLTGETGAGKSLLLGSVGMALGERTGSDVIRHGTQSALAELIFTTSDSLKATLNEADIPVEDDGTLILTRKLQDTRSTCKVNGETFPATKIKELASYLIDIHGQHDNQTLLKQSAHRSLLDNFAGKELNSVLLELKDAYQSYSECKKKLLTESVDEIKKQHDIELFQHEINEIDSAKLMIGEDEQLEEQFRLMNNSKRIIESVSVADNALNSGSIDSIGRAIREIRSVSEYDSNLEGIESILTDIEELMSEATRSISDYISDMSFSEEDFARVQSRYDLVNTLKNRFGKTIEEVLEYAGIKRAELEKYINYDAYIESLNKELGTLENRLSELCEKASDIRRKAALLLENEMEKALLELNFEKACFKVSFKRTADYMLSGFDDVEFLISLNPGEEVKPLKNVASGGELSRIMLALRTIGADRDGIDTLIFDEIDAGISGRTADMVAKKLSKLSRTRQVICITHLPQIACYADMHYVIEKSSDSESTVTTITKLDEDKSIDELTRLLGDTQAARENAKELLDKALEFKNCRD